MKRKLKSLLVACIMFGGLTLLPSAVSANIQPRYMCVNCNWYMTSFCNKDYRLYDSGTHTTLLGKSCYLKLYDSFGGYKCFQCGRISSDMQGRHACKQVHASCGKGTVKVCPMNGGVLPTTVEIMN